MGFDEIEANLMKIITLAFLMITFTSQIFANQTNKWEGIYTFDEESWDEDGTRSSRWFRLEVTKKDKTLIGIYSDGDNSKTFRKFLLTVAVKKNNAIFYVANDLLLPAKQSSFHKGWLLFELRDTGKEIKEKPIQTIWGKVNLASQSESGGISEGNIFFKKV